MSVDIIVGINWGDEGKGRMIDYLAQDADYVVRFQGGNNAGHTVINEHGEFSLHLIPSGIFNSKVTNVLGPGMVIDLQGLVREIHDLEARGIDVSNIRISDRATICFPFHRWEDVWEEERLGKKAFGSTRKGIAPAYGDRYLKKTIQIGTLADKKEFRKQLEEIVKWKNHLALGIYNKPDAICIEEMAEWAFTLGDQLMPYICDTSNLLESAAKGGKKILMEAQLGALRDVTFGIYPFTTSSNTLAGAAPMGSGLLSHNPDRVVGVMKAFSTCVGAGPFVTEDFTAFGENLRESAKEFGATTGRPRRIGHFDAVASRYGVQTQGATHLALTKLDSLSGQKTLKICTHYMIDEQKTQHFPLNYALEKATPVYEEMEGWSEDITGCRHFDDLPKAAQNYVSRIEELVGLPMTYISVGPERESLMVCEANAKKAA